MRRAVVIGAGSGIGAALVDRLAASPDYAHVVAVSGRETKSLGPDVTWIKHDALNDPAGELTQALRPLSNRLHTVFVCIGYLHHGDRQPEKALGQLELAHASRSFQVNAYAPLKCVEACLPLLFHDEPSSAFVLSAKVGSIGDNRLGGWYSYRMSKAALNMGIKTLAIEVGRRNHHPLVAAVHPGTTRSSLSNRFLRNRPCASARVTADRLIALAGKCDPDLHGRFVHWDGTELPW